MNQWQTVLARKFLDAEAARRGEENYTSPDDVVSLLGPGSPAPSTTTW